MAGEGVGAVGSGASARQLLERYQHAFRLQAFETRRAARINLLAAVDDFVTRREAEGGVIEVDARGGVSRRSVGVAAAVGPVRFGGDPKARALITAALDEGRLRPEASSNPDRRCRERNATPA